LNGGGQGWVGDRSSGRKAAISILRLLELFLPDDIVVPASGMWIQDQLKIQESNETVCWFFDF
jgi:hypothetical protein